MATARVKEILSWYSSENPGVKTNLARLMNHGRLAGTGKFVILPVDQGFEHGPARSFAPSPGYDPRYHVEPAIEAGCNAYAALVSSKLASDCGRDSPSSSSTIRFAFERHRALQRRHGLGGGTTARLRRHRLPSIPAAATQHQYETLRELILEAKPWACRAWCGLSRGSGLSRMARPWTWRAMPRRSPPSWARTSSNQPPKKHLEVKEAAAAFEKANIPIETLADRVRK